MSCAVCPVLCVLCPILCALCHMPCLYDLCHTLCIPSPQPCSVCHVCALCVNPVPHAMGHAPYVHMPCATLCAGYHALCACSMCHMLCATSSAMCCVAYSEYLIRGTCALPCSLCHVLFVMCPVPYALCHIHCTKCPVPHALCHVLCAISPVPRALCHVPRAIHRAVPCAGHCATLLPHAECHCCQHGASTTWQGDIPRGGACPRPPQGLKAGPGTGKVSPGTASWGRGHLRAALQVPLGWAAGCWVPGTGARLSPCGCH